MNAPEPRLRTARLLLRPANPADATAVHEYRADPNIATYLTQPALSLEQVRQRLRTAADRWTRSDHQRFHLLFTVLADDTIIGEVQAVNCTERGKPTSPDPTEVWVSYVFNPRHQGHGYATEAVRDVCSWLFRRGAARIFANLYTANTPSYQLLHRLGFQEHQRLSADEDTLGKNLPSVRMRLDAPG
ncbi:GNAT family N-acetyltransferase [Saccharopolyspora sp. K220]|uniref:GNAT family N-acetyltransferase n=1 Tax=Saccharopolyspora soli TaxID=2926618 RepID=UPI001F5604F5|nr:GNAT family N-acetyltransferase [Saccharopolyspora soli]MCI2421042.1 GNAT family N-acetyltransferase [Saccharopolyspora soli]